MNKLDIIEKCSNPDEVLLLPDGLCQNAITCQIASLHNPFRNMTEVHV